MAPRCSDDSWGAALESAPPSAACSGTRNWRMDSTICDFSIIRRSDKPGTQKRTWTVHVQTTQRCHQLLTQLATKGLQPSSVPTYTMPQRDTVAGDAADRSWTSNSTRMVDGGSFTRSPFGRHSVQLSSRTAAWAVCKGGWQSGSSLVVAQLAVPKPRQQSETGRRLTCVHALHPHCIHRTIKDDPLLVRRRVRRCSAYQRACLQVKIRACMAVCAPP